MKILRNTIIAVCALTASLCATAQKLTWNLDFETVFDNREGDRKYMRPETYFFTNLAPEIGLRLNDGNRIAGGVVWNQPIGREWHGYRVSPTLYYRHTSRLWSLSMGMFPREQLREEMPKFMWNDSLTYFQHNIRGALVQYHSDRAFVDFYLDWRQMQTERKREAFNVVVHGQWHPQPDGPFFAGAHAMMNHFALTRHAAPDEHIVDNFMVHPYVGVDLSRRTALDSLQIRLGALVTVERDRAVEGWASPVGAQLEVMARWRWLMLKETLYVGQNQLPSYMRHGPLLYQAEPFYQSKVYNRTDVIARFYSTRYVDLEASLDFNVTRESFIFYQRLTARVYIGSR